MNIKRTLKDKKGVILCVVGVVSTILGTVFAVKAGSDIKAEMEEKKPEKTLDKAKVYVKHLWPTILCDTIAIASNIGCYKDGVHRERIAMDLAYGYQAQLMASMQEKLNKQLVEASGQTITVDDNGKPVPLEGEVVQTNFIDENKEITVVIPVAGDQRIKTTLLKLYRDQTALNKMMLDDGEVWLDAALEVLGGKPIGSTKFFSLDAAMDEPHHPNQDVFDYLGNWINFNLTLDLMTGEFILTFNMTDDAEYTRSGATDIFRYNN